MNESDIKTDTENEGTRLAEDEGPTVVPKEKEPNRIRLNIKKDEKGQKKARFVVKEQNEETKPKTLEEKELEAEQQKLKMRRSSKKRFGIAVRFENYTTSMFIKLVCMFMAVIIIPLEIFMQKLITHVEMPMILSLQQSLGHSESLLYFFNIPLTLVRP